MSEVLVSQELYKKITIITIDKGIIVGEITRLQKGNVVVKVLHQKNMERIENEQSVRMQIDHSENGESYNYTGEIVSIHTFDKEKLIFIKPLTLKKEKNRRLSKRVKIAAIFDRSLQLKVRYFPPIDKTWIKGEIVDISEGGVKLELIEYFDKQQLVEIILQEPFIEEQEILLCQIVNRTKEENAKQYTYSIHFLNMNDKHSMQLEKYVDQAIQKIENK